MTSRVNKEMMRESSDYIDVEADQDLLDNETYRDAVRQRKKLARQGYEEEDEDDDVFLDNVQLPNFQTNDSPHLMNPKWAPVLTKKQRDIG